MELPPPWEIRESKNYKGRCFYFNKVTQEATWIRPIPYPGNRVPWPPAVYVAQILIKHYMVKDPNSPRGPVTRTQEEAKKLLKQIVEQITKNETPFGEMAKQYSDDIYAEKEGVVGWITRNQMPQEYEDMAWQLRIGEMSPPVNTADGSYIILRRG